MAQRALRAKTPTFSHHGIVFSPFFEDRIAVASAANFGLVGNGRIHVMQITPSGLSVLRWWVPLCLMLLIKEVRYTGLRIRCRLERVARVRDALHDQSHGRNQVIAACGNGALRLFDVTLEASRQYVLRERLTLMTARDYR